MSKNEIPEYRKKTPLDSAYYPNPNVNPKDRRAPWRMNTYAPNNPYGPGGDPYSAIYGARSFAGAIKDSQELGNWLEGVLREAYKEQNVPYPEFKNKLNGNIYIQGAHSSPTRIDHKQRVEYSLAPTRGSSAMKRMSKSMDMKTRNPKMPSTKRDIRDTDKYFN